MDDATADSLLGGQVSLRQPQKGHRAGSDAVLLAAAAAVQPGQTVVDVGASTGAVGLMVAARERQARFVFVERDPGLASLCRQNCDANGIDATVVEVDVLDAAARLAAGLQAESADLVLTNPPFLEEGKARLSPDRARAAAHALPAGGLEAWIKACLNLLKPKGRLVLIHRADRLADCLDAMKGRFGGISVRFVHPAENQPAIRLILSAKKGSRAPMTILPPVVLHDSDGRFTPFAAALHRGEALLT
ncbi:tRNA1(Val) (adenine(37)-N6)-methyltransferase [Microvirga rosea]|uniref:tRNA1(Val) (adenine(37)-N6)-methyltransferase n=1 Tax=Microvirga rosea TaxID=2715425 RepID=UPI001D0AEC7D|nr:methyltransferase [Microvirga rosea]MCB8820301.1 methyltransferase [Microvirga rosea]